MIGKVMKGRGFAGLARYLETGRDGNSPDRVEWVEARNVPTNDPETASLIMRATAAQSDRVQKPVYHIALSFDPDDGADHATMIRVADRLLNDLGLQEHQALIVAHGDTAHAHVHLMINRVHPETFRAWHPQHDYARVERSLREQERELALRAVPGHHYRLDGHELPDRSQALTSGQLRRWERTSEVPFDELVRNIARRHLVEATSWRDLEARLSPDGLRLEPRGRGLVVTDGKEEVKLSSVARGVSRANLERRFGAMDGKRQDIGERRSLNGPARTAPARERDAGAAGRDAGEHVEARGAPAQAERDGTKSGVHGRDVAAASRPDRVAPDGRDRPGADRRNAGRNGSGAVDPRLVAVRRSIEALERRIGLERTRDTARDDLDRARMRLHPFVAQRAEARAALERFRAALPEVYRNPAEARQAFYARARSEGVSKAAEELSRHPERFGALRGSQVGPVRSAERAEALGNAAKLGHLGAEHLRRIREAWANRSEYRQARTNVVSRERRVQQLDAKLVRGPGSERLKQSLRRQLRAVQPVQRRQLYRSLPIPHRRIVSAAIAAARAFAHEQGHER